MDNIEQSQPIWIAGNVLEQTWSTVSPGDLIASMSSNEWSENDWKKCWRNNCAKVTKYQLKSSFVYLKFLFLIYIKFLVYASSLQETILFSMSAFWSHKSNACFIHQLSISPFWPSRFYRVKMLVYTYDTTSIKHALLCLAQLCWHRPGSHGAYGCACAYACIIHVKQPEATTILACAQTFLYIKKGKAMSLLLKCYPEPKRQNTYPISDQKGNFYTLSDWKCLKMIPTTQFADL